jgi:predicted RNA-binding Zn-ribbon protein involved in translation (DUF1610 family)
MVVCLHCGEVLIWNGNTYVHPGGGLYVVYCRECGWSSDKAEDQRVISCPKCGCDVRDHHVVLAMREENT